MDKKFYIYLPTSYCKQLDSLIEKYSNESWFKDAWNEYKFYVKMAKGTLNLKSPSYVFDKYTS